MEKEKLRVLWLCNMMPGFVSRSLGMKGTNKEGWIEGCLQMVKTNKDIELAIAFPTQADNIIRETKQGIMFFGFVEDVNHPEKYDSTVEAALGLICEEYNPDVIHIFGTEFPHALAMVRLGEWKSRTVIHLQGIMERCAQVYEAGIPKDVFEGLTFRDVIKHDSIVQQKEKYTRRALNERKVLLEAQNVCGRTAFDKAFMEEINPSCRYFGLNETLRSDFYGQEWKRENITPHTIFLSQGNIPLKGAHFAIEAINLVKKKYSDVRLLIAGDKITSYETFKDKLKISSYGKYLRNLVVKNNLEDDVTFIGSISARKMLSTFLSSEIFLMGSVIENSPNSLGEAMILGMPCIASNVGGIPSLCTDRKEVLMYDPYNSAELADRIIELFEHPELEDQLRIAARNRALLTHDSIANYKMLLWIYETIAAR